MLPSGACAPICRSSECSLSLRRSNERSLINESSLVPVSVVRVLTVPSSHSLVYELISARLLVGAHNSVSVRWAESAGIIIKNMALRMAFEAF